MAFFCRRELDFSQNTTAITSAFAACRHELKGLSTKTLNFADVRTFLQKISIYCQAFIVKNSTFTQRNSMTAVLEVF